MLRAGLLGAGAGAVGGAASGGKSRDIWKGALAGIGVNLIGGALLDSISGGNSQPARQTVYTREPASHSQPVYYHNSNGYDHGQAQHQSRTSYSEGYQAGYYNGFKEGYLQGLRDAAREQGF